MKVQSVTEHTCKFVYALFLRKYLVSEYSYFFGQWHNQDFMGSGASNRNGQWPITEIMTFARVKINFCVYFQFPQ